MNPVEFACPKSTLGSTSISLAIPLLVYLPLPLLPWTGAWKGSPPITVRCQDLIDVQQIFNAAYAESTVVSPSASHILAPFVMCVVFTLQRARGGQRS